CEGDREAVERKPPFGVQRAVDRVDHDERRAAASQLDDAALLADRGQRLAGRLELGGHLVFGHPVEGHRHVAALPALEPPAAADARCRLESVLDVAYDELSVFSVDDLCERILRDEALEAGLDPMFAPVSAADRLALLLERIDDLPLRRHEIRGNPAPLLAS